MTTTAPPFLVDRRRFLGLCAMAAVVAACGDSHDDDAAASAGTVAAPGTRATTEATDGPALRVASVAALSTGQLIHVAFGYPLDGALACDGTTASVTDWPELAALLGTTFGGDGSTTFGLPALPVGDGLSWVIVGEGVPFANGQPGLVGEVRPMVAAPATGSALDMTWLPCDGRRLPIAKNAALFALMGTTFGGDGRVDFALPDLPAIGGLPWRISSRGQFPSTTCDAVTPAFPDTPLEAYVGSIVHLAYTDDMASRACGVALCRGQVVTIPPWLDLAAVIGDNFGGDARQGTMALPTLPVDRGITPAIVVNGTFPRRA
jgi:microcystin-dependent protein